MDSKARFPPTKEKEISGKFIFPCTQYGLGSKRKR